MKDEIIAIIYNKNISNLDKIISISKIVEGHDLNSKKLSEVTGVPEDFINMNTQFTLTSDNSKSEMRQYFDKFYSAYYEIEKTKYNFTGIDANNMKLIKKSITLHEFEKIMRYIVMRHKQKEAKTIEFELKVIMQNLTPARIYKNINLLLKMSNTSNPNVFGYGVNKGAKK